jgi:hypothetical protein
MTQRQDIYSYFDIKLLSYWRLAVLLEQVIDSLNQKVVDWIAQVSSQVLKLFPGTFF